MSGNDRAATGHWMVEDEVAAGGMVENESVLLEEADDLTRFDRGELRHTLIRLLESCSVIFQREYSRSRVATSVLSSVGIGSLCLRRLAI